MLEPSTADDLRRSLNSEANAAGSALISLVGREPSAIAPAPSVSFCFAGPAGGWNSTHSFKHVKFRPARFHIKTKSRAQVRHFHLGSVNPKTVRLWRHISGEAPSKAGNLPRGKKLKLGWPFHYNASAADKTRFAPDRFEPQQSWLQCSCRRAGSYCPGSTQRPPRGPTLRPPGSSCLFACPTRNLQEPPTHRQEREAGCQRDNPVPFRSPRKRGRSKSSGCFQGDAVLPLARSEGSGSDARRACSSTRRMYSSCAVGSLRSKVFNARACSSDTLPSQMAATASSNSREGKVRFIGPRLSRRSRCRPGVPVGFFAGFIGCGSRSARARRKLLDAFTAVIVAFDD